jgi:hypothetical protein
VKLFIEWNRALILRDASKQNLIYDIDLTKIPDDAGLYIFGRRWGSGFEALYVGKAYNVRGRVKSQMNNLRLMQHLRNAKTGSRVLFASQIMTKPGQRLDKCLVLIERALIRYFLSEGDDLVNKQGTRIRRHEVFSSGKHPKRFVPSTMFVERGTGE